VAEPDVSEAKAAGGMASPPADEDFDKLLESVNAASRHCRNVYLTFLLLALYIALLVGSTTDEQLLRGTSVVLPVLNVGLPIVAVYTVVPPIFVLLHFNLLLQLHSLSCGIRQLTNVSGTAIGRIDLFPFTQMLVGHRDDALISTLNRFIVWMALCTIPLSLSFAVQVWFLGYHSDWITLEHAVLVSIDLGMVWWIWPKLVSPSGRWADWQVFARKGEGHRGMAATSLLFSSVLLYGTWIDANVPEGYVERHFRGPEPLVLLDKFPLPGVNRPRYLDLAERTLVAEEAPPELLAPFAKNDAAELDAAKIRHSKGLVLFGRDLRGANLFGARLYKADLGRVTSLPSPAIQSVRLTASCGPVVGLPARMRFALHVQAENTAQ